MNDPEPAFGPFSSSDDYVLLVNNTGGTSTPEMYAIADETLLQLSKIPPIPLSSLWILTNFVQIQRPILACNRQFIGAFEGFLNQPGISLILLNLTHVAKSV